MTPQELEEEMLSNPVQNLQYMLRRLGTRYSFLPQLATDGLFGEETLEAVMLFQRELAPPVTGVVDFPTWYKISQIYRCGGRPHLGRHTAGMDGAGAGSGPTQKPAHFPRRGRADAAWRGGGVYGPAPNDVPAAAPAAGGDRGG